MQHLKPVPYEGILGKGFGHSIIWIKLRLDPSVYPPPKLEQDRLVLRIRPVYLDDIRVYDPLSPEQPAGQTGDRRHPAQDELRSIDFLVPVARGSEPREIWIRLQSTSTRQIDIAALNVEDLDRRLLGQTLLSSIYLGLVFVLAAWATVRWSFGKEPLIGAFSVSQWFALGFATLALGHARAVWPESWSYAWLDWGVTITSIGSVSTAVIFHFLLLADFKPPRWLTLAQLTQMALFPAKLVLAASGWITEALLINITEALVSPVIYFCGVLFAKGWHQPVLHQPALPRFAVTKMREIPGRGDGPIHSSDK